MKRANAWAEEFQDLLRGVGGAAIIGIPLVYTMEVWQLATMLSPRNVLYLFLIGFFVCVGFNFVSGFRHDSGLKRAFLDAIEALALGAALSLLLLALLRIIDLDTPLQEAVRRIALEAVPLALGASIARTQFGEEEAGDGNSEAAPQEEEPEDKEKEEPAIANPALREAGLSLAGAIVFAANVAPTEEIMWIAGRLTWLHLLLLLAFSLALSYGMIFVAEFGGLEERKKTPGLLQTPVGETLMAYAIALGVSLVMFLAFHGTSPLISPAAAVAGVLALGLPATVGGAAGRLIL